MSGSAHEPLVVLGVLIGAHGVHGELRVKLWNPSSTVLDRRKSVLLRKSVLVNKTAQDEVRELRVQARRRHQDLLLLTLEGCSDRDAAIALRGLEVCVPRSALPKLPPGEFYLNDLVGLRAQLPSGESIGTVQAVIPYPTTDAIAVMTERGVIEVPLLPPYLVQARVEDGVIEVDELDELEAMQLEPARKDKRPRSSNDKPPAGKP